MVIKTFAWPVNEIYPNPHTGVHQERTAHERRWFIQGAMDALDGKVGAEGVRPAPGMNSQTWEAYRLGYEAGQRYKRRKAGES
jgi:hypothetical protein